MSSTDKIVLYSFYRSSASWRLRIALALKGVEFEYRATNLYKNEQMEEEFVQINKMSQLPVLIMDGMTMTQSLPIMEYLDETRDGPDLFPKDPKKRFRCRQIAEIINSGVHPVQNSLRHIMKDDADRRKQIAVDVISKGMETIEGILQETSGQFCVGDSVSAADICLVPQIFKAFSFGVSMDVYPRIMKVYEHCQQHPAFKAADPALQPDAPPKA